MARDERKTFKYHQPSADAIKARANQKGGMFDSPWKGDVKMFKLPEGDNRVRIMPPGWDDPVHFGIEVWSHRDIGSDRGTYLCLKKMKNEPCPICEEEAKARKQGEGDYADELKPKKQVAVYVIDRDDENEGPQVWPMSWTLERNFMALAVDKSTNEVLYIDHPEEGFDLEFKREGKMLKTKYFGEKIARKSTPLCDDEKTQAEWLQFIQDHPLPDCLNWYDYDYIKNVFAGQAPKDDKDKDVSEPRTRGESRDERGSRDRGKDKDEATERPRGRDRDREPEKDEPTARRGREPIDDPNADLDTPRSGRSSSRDRDKEPEPEPEPRRGRAREEIPAEAEVEFKKGDKVSWEVKGKEYTGIVRSVDEDAKELVVLDDKTDEKEFVLIKDATLIEDKPKEKDEPEPRRGRAEARDEERSSGRDRGESRDARAPSPLRARINEGTRGKDKDDEPEKDERPSRSSRDRDKDD